MRDEISKLIIWIIFKSRYIILTIYCIIILASFVGMGFIVYKALKPHEIISP